MSTQTLNPYLRNAVMTATPEQLQLMLYDGAIRFAVQGQDALRNKDYAQSCDKLIRAQHILLEMQNGLRREVHPELCDRMAAIYGFIYSRLVDANTAKDPAAVDDALRVLRYERETWVMLMDKVAGERARTSACTADDSASISEASVSLSLKG